MRVLFAEHGSSRKQLLDGTAYAPFEQLLRESDVISLHTPLRPETRNMIALEQFRMMKRTALLDQHQRAAGSYAHELDRNGAQGGADRGRGLRCADDGAAQDGNPLLDPDLPNFILTPHVAWASHDAMQFLADQLIDNIEAFVRGKPQHLVT